MGEAIRKENRKEGWSFGEEHVGLPRHELPSEHFHSIEIPGDPESAAWDEPGYVDPDLRHANLPPGSRYWLGFAKKAGRIPHEGEERPLSPGLVARVTRRFAAGFRPATGHPDWEKRIRPKERDRGATG